MYPSIRSTSLDANTFVFGLNLGNDADLHQALPTRFHFVLDNSGSMGRLTSDARDCFAELILSATAPCSLVVFASHATEIGRNFSSIAEMRNAKIPAQGQTNITAGVSMSLDIILDIEKSVGAGQTHHVLVLLSDGAHNNGQHPEAAAPGLGQQLKYVSPHIQLSVIVVGVSRSSNTNMGMIMKTNLETLPLPTLQPIYFAQTPSEMGEALVTMREGLEHSVHGLSVQIQAIFIHEVKRQKENAAKIHEKEVAFEVKQGEAGLWQAMASQVASIKQWASSSGASDAGSTKDEGFLCNVGDPLKPCADVWINENEEVSLVYVGETLPYGILVTCKDGTTLEIPFHGSIKRKKGPTSTTTVVEKMCVLPDKDWTCSVCTFINKNASALVCEVCNTEKNAVVEVQSNSNSSMCSMQGAMLAGQALAELESDIVTCEEKGKEDGGKEEVGTNPNMFDEELAAKALEVLLEKARISKVVQNGSKKNKSKQSGQNASSSSNSCINVLKKLIDSFETQVGRKAAMLKKAASTSIVENNNGFNFSKFKGRDRVRQHKLSSRTLHGLKELKNQLAAIEAFDSTDSSSQAEFLNGSKSKFAAKALSRNAKRSLEAGEAGPMVALIEECNHMENKMKQALRADMCKRVALATRETCPVEIRKKLSMIQTTFPPSPQCVTAAASATQSDICLDDNSSIFDKTLPMDVTTALTVVIPSKFHSNINIIRQKFDKAFPRWMPHINLLFPFVGMENFPEIQSKLHFKLKAFGSIQLTFDKITFFKQGKVNTYNLQPKDDTRLQELYAIVKKCLPTIKSKHPEFRPHMTLGQAKTSDHETMMNELTAWLGGGFSVVIDCLSLIKRVDYDPFEVKDIICLESGATEVSSLSSSTSFSPFDNEGRGGDDNKAEDDYASKLVGSLANRKQLADVFMKHGPLVKNECKLWAKQLIGNMIEKGMTLKSIESLMEEYSTEKQLCEELTRILDKTSIIDDCIDEYLSSGSISSQKSNAMCGGNKDRSSYLSLLTAREQLTEWAETASECGNICTGGAYEALMFLGTLAYPIDVERRAATQLDPYAMTITRVRTSLIDTASLCCALKSNHELVPPEGGVALSDALVLVDPDCPRASKLCMKSKIVGEMYTSVVLARDLNMYTGTTQRVALHAHAFASLAKPKNAVKVYKEKRKDLEAMLQRTFLGQAYQCGSCGFGPIDHTACGDLEAHHGEVIGDSGVAIDNSCPKCRWFSQDISDWPTWNGVVPEEMFQDRIGKCVSSDKSSLKKKQKMKQHKGEDQESCFTVSQSDEDERYEVPSQSNIEVMLRIIYSARSVLGVHTSKELVSKLANWEESVTAADGVDHPFQMCLAIACLCDQDEMENVFTAPPLLMLINEMCSRAARDELNMKFSAINKAAGVCGGAAAATAVEEGTDGEENLIGLSRKFVTRMLGITTASAPEAKGLEESEPPLVVVRESCCGDVNIKLEEHAEIAVAAASYDEYGYEVNMTPIPDVKSRDGGQEEEFDFESFVNASTEPVCAMLLFSIALRKAIQKRGGGWTRLEQDMETGLLCYQDIINSLSNKNESLLGYGPTSLLDALLSLDEKDADQIIAGRSSSRNAADTAGNAVDQLEQRIKLSFQQWAENSEKGESFKGKKRMLATMTAQAFLHYNSRLRRSVTRGGCLSEPLGDVRDGSTLRNLAIDLRMFIYQQRVGEKMKQWKSVGSDIVVAKARAADIGQYMDMIAIHAHGLDKPTFWGLWHAARSDGAKGEKVKYFLSKANSAFATAHASP